MLFPTSMVAINLEGRLVMFPKSPTINRNIFAIEVPYLGKPARYFTILPKSFEGDNFKNLLEKIQRHFLSSLYKYLFPCFRSNLHLSSSINHFTVYRCPHWRSSRSRAGVRWPSNRLPGIPSSRTRCPRRRCRSECRGRCCRDIRTGHRRNHPVRKEENGCLTNS